MMARVLVQLTQTLLLLPPSSGHLLLTAPAPAFLSLPTPDRRGAWDNSLLGLGAWLLDIPRAGPELPAHGHCTPGLPLPWS